MATAIATCRATSWTLALSGVAGAFAADAQTFFEAFVAECSRVLLVYKREPAVERLVDFVAMFAEAAPGWNEEFAVGLLQLRASWLLLASV